MRQRYHKALEKKMNNEYVKIQSALAEGKTVEICFVSGPIEDLESYVEPHMKAILTGIHQIGNFEDEVAKLELDFTKFDKFNRAFEKANYYDKHGNPCLTAREAGQYKIKDTIYIGTHITPDCYFYWRIISQPISEIQELHLFRDLWNKLPDDEGSKGVIHDGETVTEFCIACQGEKNIFPKKPSKFIHDSNCPIYLLEKMYAND